MINSTTPASPNIRIDIQSGSIKSNGTVVAHLSQKYSAFNGVAFGGTLGGTYQNGVLTLVTTQIQFAKIPTEKFSSGITNMQATFDITLST